MMNDSSASKLNGEEESLWNYLYCVGAIIGGILYFTFSPKLVKSTPILIANTMIYPYSLLIYTIGAYALSTGDNIFSRHPTEGYFGYLSSPDKFLVVVIGLGFFGGFIANQGYTMSLLAFTP